MRIGINVDAPLKKCASEKNVAPAARIYLHLICRKRHLPLKLRKGKTMGCAAKLNIALAFREAATVYSNVPNRDTGKNRIRRCVNSPLKNPYPLVQWR